MNRRIVLGLLLTGVTGVAIAQEGQQVLEKMKLQEVQIDSRNSALLQTVRTSNIGESTASYTLEDGDFKHPLLAAQSHYFDFSSKRYQEFKGWKLYGRFDLRTGIEKDVPHTSQLDPLRLNPYILMDSLQGDWNKQRYGLEAKVASPFFNDRIAVGLGLKYAVNTGARQRDPRPENTQNDLELIPSVAYKFNERNILGLFGSYNYLSEDVKITSVNYNVAHNLYKLLGLGEYEGSSPIFLSSGDLIRRYAGNRFGGGLNYSYTHGGFRSHLEGFFQQHTEKAMDGSIYPKNAGEHRYKRYGFQADLSQTTISGIHQLRAEWVQTDIENKEFHQYQDPITRNYVTLFSDVLHTNLVTQTALGYQFGRLKDDKLSWKVGAKAQYNGWDNRYATNKSQQTVDRMQYAVDFDQYFIGADRSGLVLHVGLGYSDAFKTVFKYEEKAYSTNFIAEEVLYPTNAFMSTDFWQVNGAVQYVFKPTAKSGTQFYIKASGGYLKPTEGNAYFAKSMSRMNGQLAIGIFSF